MTFFVLIVSQNWFFEFIIIPLRFFLFMAWNCFYCIEFTSKTNKFFNKIRRIFVFEIQKFFSIFSEYIAWSFGKLLKSNRGNFLYLSKSFCNLHWILKNLYPSLWETLYQEEKLVSGYHSNNDTNVVLLNLVLLYRLEKANHIKSFRVYIQQ